MWFQWQNTSCAGMRTQVDPEQHQVWPLVSHQALPVTRNFDKTTTKAISQSMYGGQGGVSLKGEAHACHVQDLEFTKYHIAPSTTGAQS